MSLADLLFWTNLLFCGVNVSGFFDEYQDSKYFYLMINKSPITETDDLLTEYPFEEGVKYTVTCRRSSAWDLHWEVEPFGLKSPTFNSRSDTNRITMDFKLHRDDQITIGCYATNKKSYKDENKSTTFYWRTIKPKQLFSPVHTNDAGQKCYQISNTVICAYFLTRTIDVYLSSHLVDLKINHDNIISSNQDDNYKKTENEKELSKNEKDVWVPAVAGVAVIAVLSVVCFICYMVRRKRKQNKPNAEPSIVYAEIQMESAGQLPSRENTPYAQIIGCIAKKNIPMMKKPSNNTENKTENTRIGTVERINDLYSEIKHQ